MRVIAGIHRGRTLLGPEGKQITRPITDRAKQALFDRLQARLGIADRHVLDIYCGTGSLGIECLSRGAEAAGFMENNRVALKQLRENLRMLRLEPHSRIFEQDALIGFWPPRMAEPVELIFYDPPYRFFDDAKVIQKMAQRMDELSGVTTDDAVMIVRTPTTTELPTLENWQAERADRVGTMMLHWLQRNPEP